MTEKTTHPTRRRITLSIMIDADIPQDRVPGMLQAFPAMANSIKDTPVEEFPGLLKDLCADDERREIVAVHAEVRDLGERLAEYVHTRSNDPDEPDRRECRVADDRLLTALGYALRPTRAD